MKTSILSLILFHFIALVVNGQVIYERIFDDAFPSLQFPIELSDKSTVSIANNGECSTIGFRHIAEDGSILKEEIMDYEAHSSMGTHWIGHDSVLIWYRLGPLDLGGNDSFKVKLWTPEIVTTLVTDQAFQEFEPAHKYGAYLYTPEKLIYTKRDTFYLFNQLSSSNEKVITIPGTTDAFEVSNKILVTSDQQPPVLLDQNLEVAFSWQQNQSLPFSTGILPVTIDSFIVGRDSMLSTTISAINVFNEEKLLLDFSGYFDTLEDIQQHKGIIFLKGFSFDEYLVVRLNAHFEIINVQHLAYPATGQEMTLQYYPDRVYAWMLDGLSHYEANYNISYSYTEADPIQWLDIALDTMWLDSVRINQNFPDSLFATCIVHNYSNEVVHSFTLHYDDHLFFFCIPDAVISYVEGVNIQPGEADTVSFAIMDIYPDPHGLPFIQIPFFIDHPNHHLDNTISNNSTKLDYLLSSISDPLGNSPIITPNPFNNFLAITNQEKPTRLTLYDWKGYMVTRGINELNGLSKLPVGIYFLQIQIGHQFLTRKVVKL